MAEQGGWSEEELKGELNALARLDRDAAAACAWASERLSEPALRTAAARFGEEHARQADDLLLLLRTRGGEPEAPERPGGAYLRGVEQAAEGGDAALVDALRAGERVVRDRYHEAAARAHPEEVEAVLRRAIADEDRHYGWAAQARTAVAGGVGGAARRARMVEAVAAGRRAAEGRVVAATRAPGQAESAGGNDEMDRARPAGGALEMVDRARATAGAELARAADAVDRAAEWAQARGGPVAGAASVARQVAGALDGSAAYLRERRPEEMRADVEREVRSKPVRSVLVAAGIGFLLGRILR